MDGELDISRPALSSSTPRLRSSECALDNAEGARLASSATRPDEASRTEVFTGIEPSGAGVPGTACFKKEPRDLSAGGRATDSMTFSFFPPKRWDSPENTGFSFFPPTNRGGAEDGVCGGRISTSDRDLVAETADVRASGDGASSCIPCTSGRVDGKRGLIGWADGARATGPPGCVSVFSSAAP